eukprot:s637_g22.t1
MVSGIACACPLPARVHLLVAHLEQNNGQLVGSSLRLGARLEEGHPLPHKVGLAIHPRWTTAKKVKASGGSRRRLWLDCLRGWWGLLAPLCSWASDRTCSGMGGSQLVVD